jgi:hypothetical protein
VLPITGIVSTPDEATMSFVVNPFAAAFLFGLAVSLWACGSVVCLLVVEADVEDQAVAAGGAVA